jgi:hypothetical protein
MPVQETTTADDVANKDESEEQKKVRLHSIEVKK